MQLLSFFCFLLVLFVVGYFILKAINTYNYKKDYIIEAQRLAPQARDAVAGLDRFFEPKRKITSNDIDKFLYSYKSLILDINNLYNTTKRFDDILENNGLNKFRKEINTNALEARKNENNLTFDNIQKLKDCSDKAYQTYSALLAPSHYFAYSEMMQLLPALGEIKDLVNSLLPKYAAFVDNRDTIMANLPESIESKRKSHNINFEQRELIDNGLFFDNVLGKYPLDKQQRESIVKLEDNCLVISSAGSGKTSTSIAKVKYLLEKRHLKEQEILVMSFNNKTAAEFRERLNVPGVTCETFHAEALHIVAEVEGHRPSISDPKDHLLSQCHYILERQNQEYKTAITNFVTCISSLMKRENEYAEAKDYYLDRAKYGIVSPYLDMDGRPIYTKSEEEKRICIWLAEHDVKFKYEEPYPIPTYDSKHRQYKPDFTIHYRVGDQERVAYLEHFGIGSNGYVPEWFGDGEGGFAIADSMYKAGKNWKESLHQLNQTILLETTSAMFDKKTVYSELERQLRAIGVPLRTLSDDERHDLIFKSDTNMEDNINTLLSSIINLMKSNGKTYEDVLNTIRAHEDEDFYNRCKFLLYNIVKPLHDKYEQELKARGEKDFTDLIRLATEYCKTGKWRSPFKYIIVDEFQDISTSRYQFIQSLRQKNPITKTFLVGDDWQSIYRFAGSDLNLFQRIENYFGYTERCKIETTYRFGNPLVEASSSFILKNPCQAKKEVRPYSTNKHTNISFWAFERKDDGNYLETIKSIVEKIPLNESILLIARYNKDINVLPQSCRKYTSNSKYPEVTLANRKMKFMTVHAAKGLEEDHVILLNCSQDGGGFPSRIADDPILGYILSIPDDYEYSEERRLFYVAITRARKEIYVLYNQNMPSFFVTEMTLAKDGEDMVCPVCKKGLLKVMREDEASNGKKYRNYICSNSVAGCGFFWRVFYNDVSDILGIYHSEMDRYFN